MPLLTVKRVLRKYRLLLSLLAIASALVVSLQIPAVKAFISSRNGSASTFSGSSSKQAFADTSSLQGWWKLDGDVTDSSGINSAGSITGSAGYAAGNFGRALSLNGTSQYASLTIPNTISTPFSASTWFYPTTVDANQLQILAFGNDLVGITYNNAYTGFWTASGGCGANFLAPSVPPVVNTWNHVAITATTTSKKIYLNGKLIGSAVCSGSTNLSTTTSAKVGAYYNGTSRYFPGRIDDVRIYSRELSVDDIAKQLQGSRPINCDQSCVGNFSFNESGGTTIKDAVGTTKLPFTDPEFVPSTTGKLGNATSFVPGLDLPGGPAVRLYDKFRDYIARVFTPKAYAAGAGGNAKRFELASSAVNPRIAPGASNDFSVSVWLKPATAYDATVFYFGCSTNVDTGFALKVTSSGTVTGCVTNGTTTISATSTATISTGSWNHVVTSVSRSGSMQMYVNGSASGSASVSAQSSSTYQLSGDSLTLGGSGNQGSAFDGGIDELGYWRRALSASDVTSLYNSGNALAYSGYDTEMKHGLIAYWPLDESSAGTGAVARAEGHGAASMPTNLTFNSTTNGWVSGKFGTALRFLGSSSTYFTVPGSTSYEFGTGDFTISGWLRTTASCGGTCTLMSRVGSSTTGGVIVSLNSSNYLSVSSYVSTTAYTLAGNTALNDGKWHHFAYTRSGGVQRVYIDGAQQTTQTSGGLSGGSVTTNNTADLIFGAGQSASNFYTGDIDDVKFQNRLLQPYEIFDQYNAGASGS